MTKDSRATLCAGKTFSIPTGHPRDSVVFCKRYTMRLIAEDDSGRHFSFPRPRPRPCQEGKQRAWRMFTSGFYAAPPVIKRRSLVLKMSSCLPVFISRKARQTENSFASLCLFIYKATSCLVQIKNLTVMTCLMGEAEESDLTCPGERVDSEIFVEPRTILLLWNRFQDFFSGKQTELNPHQKHRCVHYFSFISLCCCDLHTNIALFGVERGGGCEGKVDSIRVLRGKKGFWCLRFICDLCWFGLSLEETLGIFVRSYGILRQYCFKQDRACFWTWIVVMFTGLKHNFALIFMEQNNYLGTIIASIQYTF